MGVAMMGMVRTMFLPARTSSVPRSQELEGRGAPMQPASQHGGGSARASSSCGACCMQWMHAVEAGSHVDEVRRGEAARGTTGSLLSRDSPGIKRHG